MKTTTKVAAGISVAALALTAAMPAFAVDKPVYVESVNSGVSIKSIYTSGDKSGDYIFPGIPDGTGAFLDNGLQLLINTEQKYNTASAALSHAGGTFFGSTVSKMTIDPKTQTVTSVSDFIKKASFYNYTTGTWGSTPVAPEGAAAVDSDKAPNHTTFVARFCSASLSPAGRLAFKQGGVSYGIKDGVFLNAEETNDEGRAFATNVSTGELVQIPAFGLGANETFNVIPTNSKVTAVLGNEDAGATDSQLTMYVGTKKTSGTWYNKAGFTGGTRYVISVDGLVNESSVRAMYTKGNAAPVVFNAVSTEANGAQQNAWAKALGTNFARVEDGAFDPNHPNDYYFLTTESNKNAAATAVDPALPSVSRDGGAMWRLRFKDVKNPLKGATITMLLDGTEAPYLNKPDNLEVDGYGNIIIQEDPGNSDLRTRIFAYRIRDAKIAVLAQFKSEYFDPTAATFITKDEETSGILNVTNYLKTSKNDKSRYYTFVAQVHSNLAKARPDITDATAQAAMEAGAVEGGQVYIMKVPNWTKVYK